MNPKLMQNYYYRIERSISQNARGRNISGKGMVSILGDVAACGDELGGQLLRVYVKRHPKLKGKIDDCWLRIFSVALIAYCWSSAVSRGKAFDKKRNKKGRVGWLRKHDELPKMMAVAYRIGEEIVNQRLSNDRDFNNSVFLGQLMLELTRKRIK